MSPVAAVGSQRCRASSHERSAWLLCVALLVGSPAGLAHGASGADWLPLAVGREWAYGVHWDVMSEPSDGPAKRSFSRGRILERAVAVERAPRAEGRLFRLAVEIERRPMDGSDQRRERRNRHLSAGDRGGFLWEAGAALAEGGWPRVDEPPIRILPAAPDPGVRWTAGTLVLAELKIDLRGEILGYEDVETDGARYPGCLHVRLTGTPRGWTASEIGRGQVTGGSAELELWFAREVGIVKSVNRTDLEIEFPAGETARLSRVVTRDLERSETAP